jgi:hypothetical protein
MRREALVALAMVGLLLLSGCTSSPAGPPSPKNPAGLPLLDVRQAVTYGRNYMYQLYAGSSVAHDFTLTRRMVGSPCAWNGTDAGNATSWTTYYEGIMYDGGDFRYIQYAVEVHFKGSDIFVSHAKVQVKKLSTAEVNSTARDIEAVSLEPYVNVSSHDLFVKADAARWNMSAGYYLQSINISLNHNTSARYAPSTASWEIAYRYYDRSDGAKAVSAVVIDAGTLKLLKVEPPR